GGHNFQVRAVDAAGNFDTTPASYAWNIDSTAPVITITSPVATTYQLNASVAASYVCADSGSGIATCQGTVPNGTPIDTSSTGTGKQFTVTGTDNAGNMASAIVFYNVTAGGGGGSTSADLGI